MFEKKYICALQMRFSFVFYMENMHRRKTPLLRGTRKKAGCSPETVRKAIRELQQQGVVENLRVGYAVTSDSTQITAYRQRYLISIKEEYLIAKAKVEI